MQVEEVKQVTSIRLTLSFAEMVKLRAALSRLHSHTHRIEVSRGRRPNAFNYGQRGFGSEDSSNFLFELHGTLKSLTEDKDEL